MQFFDDRTLVGRLVGVAVDLGRERLLAWKRWAGERTPASTLWVCSPSFGAWLVVAAVRTLLSPSEFVWATWILITWGYVSFLLLAYAGVGAIAATIVRRVSWRRLLLMWGTVTAGFVSLVGTFALGAGSA